jgi:dUTP pyrophosphatase
MKLLIKTENDTLKTMYTNNQFYNPGDSGLDLFCPETVTIQPGDTFKINLQINCEALSDDGNVSYYLYPRSSIIKTPLRMSNCVGIIDAGYRGDIIACVDNIKDYPYEIKQGDRLFQICAGDLSPFTYELVDNLSNTRRGSGGFGSTGR